MEHSEGGADSGESGGERAAESEGGADVELEGVAESDEVERRVKMRRRYVAGMGGSMGGGSGAIAEACGLGIFRHRAVFRVEGLVFGVSVYG